jgi:hypothetical protein
MFRSYYPTFGLARIYYIVFIIIIIIIISSSSSSSSSNAATTGLLYQPQMVGDGDYGEIGGMKIGRGNRSTGRKPAPAQLCPPQIPHN